MRKRNKQYIKNKIKIKNSKWREKKFGPMF